MDSFFCVNPNIFPIFPFSPANSNIGKAKMIQSTSLSDFDSKVTMDGLYIVYGMIDNTGYISFDINWIRLQFKISLNKVQYRLRYGDSSFTAWTTFSA